VKREDAPISKSNRIVRREAVNSPTWYDRIHFLMISLVHDRLYRLMVNPYRFLYAAGIKAGQYALEVGCGPGFFTIPAAKTVGKDGGICAIDINPAAVEAVERKARKNGLSNVKVMLADASKTGLPKSVFDAAFLFGVIHDFPNVDEVMREMHRVLKSKGILSVQKSSRSESGLMGIVTENGLFRLKGKSSGIYRFSKT
jgi:ubiquinone/menaquinone biosynthesis C-methylase UbiE